MKLRALRVAAFRRFGSGVAVDQLADGINVLAGPNEMGKSTLFHALEAAFLRRYKVTGTQLDGMRPHGGGEPLVEVDFEAGGGSWRLRKQFGRGASAVLTDLASGQQVARNADAEDRVLALTGRSGDMPGPLGLVWVEQQRSLLAPSPDLDPQTGEKKPRGEHASLMDVISAELDAAVTGDAFEAVQQKARARLDVLLTPTRAGIKKNGPLELARREVAEITARLDEAKRASAAAQDRVERIAQATAELGACDTPAARVEEQARLADLTQRLNAAEAARVARDLARAALATNEAELKNLLLARRNAEDAAQRRTAKAAAHAEAQALVEQISGLTATINAEAITPAMLERLSALERAHDLANAKLSGQAVKVAITLAPSATGRLQVDGEPLVHDAVAEVPERMVIRAEGIADITVTAANAGEGAALKAKRDGLAAELATALAAIGVDDLAAARVRGEVRACHVADLDRARSRLSGLAPHGLAALTAELEALNAAAVHSESSAAGQGFDDALAKAEMNRNDAQARFAAANSAALSDETLEALKRDLQRAQAVAAARAADIARLTRQIESARAEQAGADEDGRAGQVAALSGELERAKAEDTRLTHEASALKLLEETMAAVEARVGTAYFAPVTRRLGPHLERVFGPARLGFKDQFAPDRFARGSVEEPVAALSDGTREQLSVLVRLSFAELLAERGRPVPMVLDDPLVFSDDERLAAMCDVLASAAAVPQIVVLTCRPSAFAALPGQRLVLTAWQPGA